jgi:hypothetical protein
MEVRIFHGLLLQRNNKKAHSPQQEMGFAVLASPNLHVYYKQLYIHSINPLMHLSGFHLFLAWSIISTYNGSFYPKLHHSSHGV